MLIVGCFLVLWVEGLAGEIDFNRDIRSILSNKCLTCHGPDKDKRKAGLRLDTEAGSREDLGGYAAVLPGKPELSELLARVVTEDEDDRMPPAESGARLSENEVSLLRRWIEEGAAYDEHWSYVTPTRPAFPTVELEEWVQNPIDRFVLARIEERGWEPSTEADRWALARRVAIDLTGLPPTLAEARAFVNDERVDAYERYVDSLLFKDAYGERWARVWLDLARYADSAGYADDPPRTIWAYRDYVIRALNENMPFDQFTVEQLAGDLLPNPTEEQLIATAFHRNTMTNNEGGTNDEQFRNEAIVDRVNTTMQVWMGTTMGCAQCHTHKYDPITQEEYFKFFAFFNNTEDADRRDESPTLALFTEAQRRQESEWKETIARLKRELAAPNSEVEAEQQAWETRLNRPIHWNSLSPAQAAATSRGLVIEGAVVRASGDAPEQDVYELTFPIKGQNLSALKLAVEGQKQPFAVTQVSAEWTPDEPESVAAQFVRIELPGRRKILSLAEVEVFSADQNIATKGKARQSSVGSGGVASRGIDGNTNGDYSVANSTTHTAISENPWWEVDLGEALPIDALKIWNRTDGGEAIAGRIRGYRVKLLAEDRSVVWESAPRGIPSPSHELSLDGQRAVPFSVAVADGEPVESSVSAVISGKIDPKKAWKVDASGSGGRDLILAFKNPLPQKPGSLVLKISQESHNPGQVIEQFTISGTESGSVGEVMALPQGVRELIRLPIVKRNKDQRRQVADYFRTVAPALEAQRKQLEAVEKKLKEHRPYTTVPVFRELPGEKRRKTHVQVRGNYLNKEAEVSEGTPQAFHRLPEGEPRDRLTLAKWLVSAENPLTARVIVNRHWEQLFGRGIVPTSEEFGSQGELPSHPALLDWLAVELVESGWDLKHLLKLMVTSATYQQSSSIDAPGLERDPDNVWYSRGPRFRLSAEMIRDQALFVGGLLSDKRFGPPVRPRQPNLGLKAAFGSGIDWQTSQGEDSYRRGIYTYWRRSNPYPSMVTFDAPNREVCTVRRPRSNTPLQALVTLNDPVYIEAAQGLARRVIGKGSHLREKISRALETALIRPAEPEELDRLASLFQSTQAYYAEHAEQAKTMATDPIGPAPPGADLSELAAWTVVGNALLNLDEIFLKR